MKYVDQLAEDKIVRVENAGRRGARQRLFIDSRNPFYIIPKELEVIEQKFENLSRRAKDVIKARVAIEPRDLEDYEPIDEIASILADAFVTVTMSFILRSTRNISDFETKSRLYSVILLAVARIQLTMIKSIHLIVGRREVATHAIEHALAKYSSQPRFSDLIERSSIHGMENEMSQLLNKIPSETQE